MPTLEFKGKHHIYAHHLTVPYRPLETDENPLLQPHRRRRQPHYSRRQPTRFKSTTPPATSTVSSVSTLTPTLQHR